MSEKLIELCRHIKNYFPAAFISAGVEMRIFRDGREETDRSHDEFRGRPGHGVRHLPHSGGHAVLIP